MEVCLFWLFSRKPALLGKVFAFWAALYVVLVVRKMVNLSLYTVWGNISPLELSITSYRTPLFTVVIYLQWMCCSLEPKQFQIKLNTSIILSVSRTYKQHFSQDVFNFMVFLSVLSITFFLNGNFYFYFFFFF